MDPVIEPKREALVNYKRNHAAKNLSALRTARIIAQRRARLRTNDYWQNVMPRHPIWRKQRQCARNVLGDQESFGPSVSKIAPQNPRPAKQIERSAEHCQDLYSTEDVVTECAFNGAPAASLIEGLDVPPVEKELSKAIDSHPHRSLNWVHPLSTQTDAANKSG